MELEVRERLEVRTKKQGQQSFHWGVVALVRVQRCWQAVVALARRRVLGLGWG
jgi:hypothetical protein